jgi:hypothetical protein
VTAGFDSPHLFIDGAWEHEIPDEMTDLAVTCRQPKVGAFGNWLLTAWELYARRPQAEMYAVFQDDIVLCKNVRQYVETCEYPKKGYLNLFTFASNESMIFDKPRGWYPSDQLGRGATALVFDHEAMVTLLQQPHLVNKPYQKNGHKNIDGAIQHALVVQAGWTEYIHSPSLSQHMGREGTLGNHLHPDAKTFPGEQYDALEVSNHA